jgi:DNA-damage-inducible protein J
MFAKAVINSGGIPFEVKTKQANLNTMAAIQELEYGDGHTATDIN